jgi:hypothetical protein
LKITHLLYRYYFKITPNIIRIIKSRRMKWTGQVAQLGGMRNECSVLDGKTEGKRLSGRPGRREFEQRTRKKT